VASAQIQYYEINADISEDGVSRVKMVLTFFQPTQEFSFNVIGRVEDLEATSIAGPVDCTLNVMGISSVDCKLSLTSEKRQVEMIFSTLDFVRGFEDKSFFSGDFRLGTEISQIVVSIKLPRNSFLVGRNATTSMLSYPENTSLFLSEDGRSLITWRLVNIKKDQSLKFEALYQHIQEPFWLQLGTNIILVGIAIAVISAFLFIRYFKKSRKLVLSVLDEYERQIVNLLSTEEKMKQKKIVEITNLSKAKVSRVIKSLSNRGLVEIERRGRTNLIKLKKGKLGENVFS
jgi:DNA-binding transcriptional ArsR family regulator